jgi:predicted GNAT family N-acyltransferase
MEVREAVFGGEQNVPVEFEHDGDDARSVHWVAYASSNRVVQQEKLDDQGNVIQPRKSETRSQPIGTMRIVPFPHAPHPPPGGRYYGDILRKETDADGAPIQTLTAVEEARQTAPLPYGEDRATTLHDGQEPYVKLGRVAVIKEFRGRRIAGMLWAAARQWLEENPEYFNPSVREMGMDMLKAGEEKDIPRWKGLVCCHAQETVVKTYERWGFEVDEKMGKWFEEDIPHVGMFLRLDVKGGPPDMPRILGRG